MESEQGRVVVGPVVVYGGGLGLLMLALAAITAREWPWWGTAMLVALAPYALWMCFMLNGGWDRRRP